MRYKIMGTLVFFGINSAERPHQQSTSLTPRYAEQGTAPSTRDHLTQPLLEHPTPTTDLITATYGSFMHDANIKDLLSRIKTLEQQSILSRANIHFRLLQDHLNSMIPARKQEVSYFLAMIAARTQALEIHNRSEQDQRIFHHRLSLFEHTKKALEERITHLQESIGCIEKRFDLTLQAHVRTEKRSTQRINELLTQRIRSHAMITMLLQRAFTLPQYSSAPQQENLVLERSCGICHGAISHLEQPTAPSTAARITSKKITAIMNCHHCFCLSCYEQWKGAPTYRRHCPTCKQPDDSMETFTVHFD